MARKNKRSKFHTPFNTLDAKDKQYIVAHYQRALHDTTLEGKSLRHIWKVGSQSILDDAGKILPSGATICRHGYKKSLWNKYVKENLSCTLPTYDWAKDRRIQNSLINLQEFLYGWKEQPFTMGFIASTSRIGIQDVPVGIDAEIKKEAIRDIKDSLTLVRQVWKDMLVNGRKMTVREAMWVSILSKGFEDVHSVPALDEIVNSALHYAKEESAYELLSKTKDVGSFDTTAFDAEHMIFSEAFALVTPDANRVGIEHDITSALGEAPPRFKRTYNTPYSDELSSRFKEDTLQWRMHDNKLVLGLRIIADGDIYTPQDISHALTTPHSKHLFILGVRKIIKDAGYDEGTRSIGGFNMDKVTKDLETLLTYCMGLPSYSRNEQILDFLKIEHRKFLITDDNVEAVEAEIMRFGKFTTDVMNQRIEMEALLHNFMNDMTDDAKKNQEFLKRIFNNDDLD